MQYDYKEVEVRQFRRRNRLTDIESTVSVSNRNDLSVAEHIRLLNLNDPDFEYIEIIDTENRPDQCQYGFWSLWLYPFIFSL